MESLGFEYVKQSMASGKDSGGLCSSLGGTGGLNACKFDMSAIESSFSLDLEALAKG